MNMEKDKSSKEVARSESLPATPRRNIPARSFTLPVNSRLSPPIESSNGGFFNRLKRYFRVGSKGRYNISSKSSKVMEPSLTHSRNLSPSQTMRQLRRNIPDKEEVILLHKGPRIVGGDDARMLESVSDNTIVQIVGASRNIECKTSRLDEVMSSDHHRDEASVSDDILDEMDPGYETLDEVRKKVQLQLRNASINKTNNLKDIVEEGQTKESSVLKDGSNKSGDLKNISEENVEVRSRSTERVSGHEIGEKITRDSGITTPQTNSPESYRESNGESVTGCRESNGESVTSYRESNTESVNSSVVSGSTGVADESGIEVDMLDVDNINMFDHLSNNSVYSIPSGSEDFQQRHNSDSFLMNDDMIIEEELYANPKVILRKRSQKQNLSQTEISVPDTHLSSASLGQENLDAFMPEKSVSEGDVSWNPWRGLSVESDKSAPPLPERKYTLSEEEMFREVETLQTDRAVDDTGAGATGKAEGAIGKTGESGKVEDDTTLQVESKAEETSEDSTLDAVSDGDVVTDTELESISESIAVDCLDDGYQTIKDVQAQRNAICSKISHITSVCTQKDEGLLEYDSHVSDVKNTNKCLHDVESKSDDIHSGISQQDNGDYETLASAVSRSHPSNVSSPRCSTPPPVEIEPSISGIEPSLNCVIEKSPIGIESFGVEPSSNCSEKSPIGIELSIFELESSKSGIEPSSKCTAPSLEYSNPPPDEIKQSPICLEHSPNYSDDFVLACTNMTTTESLVNTSSQRDCFKNKRQEVLVESEHTVIVCDQVSSCNASQDSVVDRDDVNDGAIIDTSVEQKEYRDEGNDVAKIDNSALQKETLACHDDICDVTMRDKSTTSVGRHNVVVIKLHESAHEDFGDPDFTDLDTHFTDLEPVHCSNRDLIRQLEQSDCRDMFKDDVKNGACASWFPDSDNKDASSNITSKESISYEDKIEPNDFFYMDDEPIHMSLDELRHPHRHNETTTVISSSAAHPSAGDTSTTNNVPAFRNDDQRETSNELTTSDYHQAFLESMSQLKDCGWYWGPLSYSEAESMLMTKPDGSFLVRDSSSEHYILSLSFKCMGTVCHTRIEHHKGVFSFFSQPESHGTSTIREFIEHAVEFSHTGQFLYFLRPLIPGSPPVAIQLLYPVSRFLKVPSLQHTCRFLILRSVRRDHIDNLPVPEKVKDYLREHQYYVENLEDEGVLGDEGRNIRTVNIEDLL